MISFSGIDLSEQPDDLAAWVAATVRPEDIEEWVPLTWPRHRTGHYPFRPWIQPEIRVGVLHWPRGASRWATCHLLADQQQVDLIRREVYQGANQYRPRDLVLDDEQIGSVTASMYLLPPRPLAQAGRGRQFYLLCLVDERWHWWYRAADIALTPGTTTWAQLYSTIGTALGVTITVDTVQSAYLKPGAALAPKHEPLPLLLDAVAACVGHRIVRQLSGNVRAWNPVNSLNRVAVNLASGGFDVYQGGFFDLLRSRGDLPAVLPETVKVAFPKYTDDSLPAGENYYVSVNLTGIAALTEYAGVIGFDGTRVFHNGAVANFNGGGAADNATELSNLATQIATDYYRWQASRLELQLVGYPAWTLEGTVDVAEYRHTADCLSLTLRRGPWEEDWTGGDMPTHGTHGSSSTVIVQPINVGGDVVLNFNVANINIAGDTVIYLGPDVTVNIDATFVFNSYFQWGVEYVTWTTDKNDFAVADTTTILVVNTTAANVDLTGIAGGVEGRVLWVVNRGSETLNLSHDDAASAAENRMLLPEAEDFALKQYEGIGLFYSAADPPNLDKWMPLDDKSAGTTLTVVGIISVGGGGWTLLGTVNYGDFTDTDSSRKIDLYTTAARQCIHHIVMKPTVKWEASGSVSSVTLIVSCTTGFSEPYFFPSYEVLDIAVSDSHFAQGAGSGSGGSVSLAWVPSFAAQTVRIQCDCVAGILSELTAGQAKIWAFLSEVPAP